MRQEHEAAYRAPLEGAHYRKRRNNVIPGIFVILGAGCVALAASMPWITISGPSIGVTFKDIVNVAVEPSWSGGADGDATRPSLLACAAVAALCGLLLMFTRRRGLGVLWRILGWSALALPALGLGYVWQLATTTASDLVDDEAPGKGLAVAADKLVRSLGLYDVQPAAGLYVWTAGVAALALGLIIPAGRSVELRD